MPRLRKGDGSIVTADGDLAANLQAQGYVLVEEPRKESGKESLREPRAGRGKSKAAEAKENSEGADDG